jgi:Asp-tRNA(Asn)/Glu-tRNA(Gln) amidotransferase A subunit family amidase
MASENAGELAETVRCSPRAGVPSSTNVLVALWTSYGPIFTFGTVSADPNKAFISQIRQEGAKEGPLVGITLAVKDLFDVSST